MSAVINKKLAFKADEAIAKARWQLPFLVFLFVSVVFVAIKVVVHRHESRTLFMELQILEKERDKFAAQWSRLKLEQGTLLNQVSVEQQARGELNMRMPKRSDIKVVHEKIKNKVKPSSSKLKGSKVALGD